MTRPVQIAIAFHAGYGHTARRTSAVADGARDVAGGWNTSTGSSEDLNWRGGFPGAMAQSHGDAGPDQAPLQADLTTAAHVGRRVAEATAKSIAGWAEREAFADPTAEDQAYVAVRTSA